MVLLSGADGGAVGSFINLRDGIMLLSIARVAKSADAKDLKSFIPKGVCGFKSRPGHHINIFRINGSTQKMGAA